MKFSSPNPKGRKIDWFKFIKLSQKCLFLREFFLFKVFESMRLTV